MNRVPAGRLATWACVAALAWTLVARAAEDSSTREAREHLGQAKIHFKLREFDAAATEFREAYRLKPIPGLLFNIAQCERMRGKFRESKFYYEQYLHDVPDAGNVDEVKHQIAELSKLIEDEAKAAPTQVAAAPVAPAAPVAAPVSAPVSAKIVVPLPAPKTAVSAPLPPPEPPAAPPPVEVAQVKAPEPKPAPMPVKTPPVEPQPIAQKPAPIAVPLKPEPVVENTKPPLPAPAITAPYHAEVETLENSGVPKEPVVEKTRSAWPVVMLVLAAVGGGTGGYFGWDARTTHDAATAAVFQDEASQKAQAAQSKALVANVLYGAAGVAAVAGLAGVLTW